MAARLEDAVRALNDVAAAVEEEEADVVSHPCIYLCLWALGHLSTWCASNRASTRPG
jgi:hypothetical protein